MVAYRDAFVQSHRGGNAFDNAADLQNVTGIGEATAENIEPYLTLENKRPVAAAASGKAKRAEKIDRGDVPNF